MLVGCIWVILGRSKMYVVVFYRMYCVFKNDAGVRIQLPPESPISANFARRDNHEVIFRRINTYLIQHKIIDRNIIDLGAWIGDNTIPWALNHPTGKIYAIDPGQVNCEYIRNVCELNKITNVVTLQTAISDTNDLLSTNEDLHHCSFVYGNTGRDGINKVVAWSLDDLYKRGDITHIGYIHLDVEGMEKKVLQGARTIISEFRPLITFEVHLELDDYAGILEYLKSHNYIIYMINEVLPGCRPDCRNSIAFPSEAFDADIITQLHTYLQTPGMLTRQ